MECKLVNSKFPSTTKYTKLISNQTALKLGHTWFELALKSNMKSTNMILCPSYSKFKIKNIIIFLIQVEASVWFFFCDTVGWERVSPKLLTSGSAFAFRLLYLVENVIAFSGKDWPLV